MTTLHRTVIGLTVVSTIAASAAADSGYRPPLEYYSAPLWQGWYAGLHLGYGDSGPANGFLGGVQIGYNWQRGQLVYGLEADVTWSDISFSDGVRVCNPEPDCISARVSGSIDWMTTARARVGYLFQPGLLAYGTAGFGHVSASASASVSGFGLTDRFSARASDTDFVYGVGLETGLSAGTTLRVEYLGFNDSDINIIRGGINFRFGN
ncbi:MAG: porin family protein [Hyphomicrobiaceae bacterium]|nr:porin family protein [Hyphomicrobiaceae bacterium]